MKKTHSVISLIAATAVLFSSLFMNAAAQNQENKEAEDDGILLYADWDEAVPKLNIRGNTPSVTVMKENGNNYLKVNTNWTMSGYDLKNVIPKNGGDYSIKFDFAMKKPGKNLFMVMLSEKDSEKGELAYYQFGLLGINDANHFMVASAVLKNVEYKEEVWYSYDMTFNRSTRNIRVEITEKNNPQNTEKMNFNSKAAHAYGAALPDRLYDTFKFSSGGDIMIDNLIIEESREKPVEIKARTEHTGNIFSKDDKKEFELDIRNVLVDDIEAEISYMVYDDDGRIVDKGKAGIFNIEKRKTVSAPLCVNVSDFYTYKLCFDIKCKNIKDGTIKEYTTDTIMFSIANKLKEGEPLNRFVAMQTMEIPDNDWEKYKELFVQAGISAMRTDLRWGFIENKEKGQMHRSKKSEFYPMVIPAGIDNMAILDAANPLYSGAGNYGLIHKHIKNEAKLEEAMLAWENYVDYVSKEYKGEITHYEILNESNGDTKPELYCQYLKKAYEIIKKNDPDAIVCGVCAAGMPWYWIEQCLQIIDGKADEYMDVITVHPYDFGEGEFKSNVVDSIWSTLLRDQIYIDKMDQLYEMMKKYHCENVRIEATETGITSAYGICSTKQQAADLVQLYASNYAQGKLDRIYWHCFANRDIRGTEDVVDDGNIKTTQAEENFGIVGFGQDPVPYAAKPAYIALCGYNKMLTDAKFIDEYINGYTRAEYFERKDKKKVIVLWTEHGYENLAFDLGADSVDIYDMYTNHIGKMESDNGRYNFTSTFEPLYIVGDFKRFEKCDNNILVDKGNISAVNNDIVEVNFRDTKNRDLEVLVDVSHYLEVTENTGIKKGEGKVVIKTTDKSFEEEPVEIRIYENDKLIYYSRIHIVITNSGFKTEYSLGNDPAGAEGRSVVNVSVTNNTSGIVMTGDLSVDFELTGGKKEKRKIVNLKPKETKTVYFNIPKSSKIHSVSTDLECDFGDMFRTKEKISVISDMNVLYNDTGFTDTRALDGDLSGSAQYAADDALACISIKDWKGPDDLSMNGTLRWDEKNLYILSVVNDDIFYQPKTGNEVWQADGLQIGIQDPVAVGEGRGEFTEIGITKTKNGNEVYRFTNQPGMNTALGFSENNNIDIEVKDGQVIYKMVFPWKELIGRDTVEKGESFLFNISANESDGGERRGFAELTEGICGVKNAQLFGKIILK